MSVSDPIAYLRRQHLQVLDHLQVLILSLEGLSVESPSKEAVEAFLGAAEEVRNEVWAHSERVKVALFPILELKLKDKAIITVILQEHRAFRQGLGKLVKLVRELKRYPSRKDLLTEVAESAESQARILKEAIRDEDEVLYPLSRRLLAREELAQVQQRLERFGLGEEPQDAFLETEKQHEEVLHLLSNLTKVSREFKAGEASPASLELFAQAQKAMAYEIRGHNRIEEEILFPILETLLPLVEMVEELRKEHEALWARLKEASLWIRRTPAHPQEAGEALEKLIREQSLHIYKENILLFPTARRLLPQEKLRELAHRVADFEHKRKLKGDDLVLERLKEVKELKASLKGLRA